MLPNLYLGVCAYTQPSKYKDPSTTARSVQLVSAVLSNAYFAVLLTLHRNFLPSNPDYPRPRPPANSQSLSHLVEAARSVIHVAAQQRVLLPPSHHLAAACHNLWSSAIILLLCEVQARDQVVVESVGSSVESCRQTLQSLEPAWPGSRKLKELLNEVESRTKEVAAAATGLRAVSDPRKKRKISHAHHEGGSSLKRPTSSSGMLPPSSTLSPRPGQTWSQSRTTPSPHSREARAYETSDTRNTVIDENGFPHYTGTASGSLSGATTGTNATPPLSQVPWGSSNGIDTSQLFDIGGVTFDGLEMLQGFDFGGNGTNGDAGFWNSFISPTAGGQFVLSGQSTPASGPSPGVWGVEQNRMGGVGGGSGGSGGGIAGMSQGQGQGASGIAAGGGASGGAGGQGGGMGMGMLAHGMDFWSQVAPGGYDWAADPNVPFNI